MKEAAKTQEKNRPASKQLTRAAVFFAAFGAIAFAVTLANICVGSVRISLSEVARILFGSVDRQETNYLIVARIRLPRAICSLAGGSALAIAGLLLQTFFNNPIVEPYVLGISSGSTLFVALVTLGGFNFGLRRMTPMAMFAGAFLGAMAVLLLILFAARKVKNIITLLVVGLMFGYLCGAGTSIMSAFAEKEKLANFSMWTMGSFAGFTWAQIRVEYLIILPMLALSFTLSKPLNALSMGEKYAVSMGINVKFIRNLLILISGVLTAAVTAFAGPVSFIGLAIPHICRILLKTSNNRLLIPASVLGGAAMAAVCDFAARNIMSPVEIPLGAVTAIIGAPMVVYLLTRRDSNASSY
jgi:iron complex transport system permease protein